MKNQPLAVGLMISQAILFAVETAMIHHIGSRGSAMQLALLRSGAGLVLVGLLAWKTGWSVLKTSQLRLQLLRGLVSVSYLWVMLYSFARLPFADATAISYTQAAYITVFSTLILNERATPLQWTAVAIGSIGALFIVKPAFGDRNIVYLIALLFGVPSFSLTIYSATYFIAQFNATEVQSGVALFGLAFAYVTGAIAGGQAVRRTGAKAPLIAGLACACVALALLVVTASQGAVVGAMLLGGLGLGLASAPPNVLLLGYVLPERAGGGTGLALMLATSGSITAPALVSAFLHFGAGSASVELRAAFAVGAGFCAACALAASALPETAAAGSRSKT